MLPAELPTISRFRGLNTVSDPLRVGLGWLTRADNTNITDTGALEVRKGYALDQAGLFTSAYATDDLLRMYLVKAGVITDYDGTALHTLTSLAPMYWAEVNNQVFFNNGTDSGIISLDGKASGWIWSVPPSPTLAAVTGNLPAGQYQVCITYTLVDGRETGPSDPVQIEITEGEALQVSGISQVDGLQTNLYIAPANSSVYQFAESPFGTATVWNTSPDYLGMDLLTDGMEPLPVGCDVIQIWSGRAYAAQYFASQDQTVVWFSQPLGFHLFDLSKDLIMVPGHVVMMAPTDTALVIGTTTRIYAYADGNLVKLADYGVVLASIGRKTMHAFYFGQRGACAPRCPSRISWSDL
ncbi:MAG: hypothetical protein IPQ22_18110 [Rhodoferax sp.]|nr:hypothetical protein [Rhodoferax sp.]